MNKRQFLKSAGMLSAASILPLGKLFSNAENAKPIAPKDEQGGCVLIPAETAGPFPLDLSENLFYFRQDVREDRVGSPLHLKMRIVGLDNCLPMPNVRVNIWQCDNVGNYSGYGTEAGTTYLRGYQIADANGEVNFLTILPGWYPGRVCHIHFRVYVNSQYAAISQLTFPEAEKQAIYNAYPELYPDGADPVAIANDGAFVDGYNYQLTTLTPGEVEGEYESFLEVTVQGSGTSGIGYYEMQNAKQFVLEQNYPNPCKDFTTIPFSLTHPSEVVIELWDLSGKKVATPLHTNLNAGTHTCEIDFNKLGLAKGNYGYQFVVTNSHGVFKECRLISTI
jgi:protocatechuate 3,4-dioxygenase beta subunit